LSPPPSGEEDDGVTASGAPVSGDAAASAAAAAAANETMEERVRGPWSPEEDAVLSNLVEKLGARNWTLIARGIPGRSGKSCRLRWCNQLDPQVKRKPFTGTPSQSLCTLRFLAHDKCTKKKLLHLQYLCDMLFCGYLYGFDTWCILSFMRILYASMSCLLNMSPFFCRRGGPYYNGSSCCPWEQVGMYRKAFGWENRQCHQESLEFHPEASILQ